MKCYFCEHNVNAGGAAQHLRKHKVILKEFIKTPEGEGWYEEYKKESNAIFKSRSPFSPDFKGCDNNAEVRKNRVKVMIEKRKSNRQNKIIQEKALYGNDYDDIINERNRLRSIKTKATSIKKLCKKYNVDEDKAYELYCFQRKMVSPRSKEYWLARGYNEEEAKENVSRWQKSCSLRSKEYWLTRGYSEEEAKENVSDQQKEYSSLNPAINRGDGSIRDNLKRRIYWIKQNDKNFINEYGYEHLLDNEYLNALSNDINTTLAILSQYNSYKIDKNRKKDEYVKAVLFFTELNATYVKDIEKRSYGYHLDHIYSVDAGFKNGVSPEIIGSVVNLRIITREQNRCKGNRCDITLDELLEKYDEFLKRI